MKTERSAGASPGSGALRLCASCGMLLGEDDGEWCSHCSRPDGSLQSYEERLGNLTSFIAKSQGLDEAAARGAAASIMARMPAWKGRTS